MKRITTDHNGFVATLVPPHKATAMKPVPIRTQLAITKGAFCDEDECCVGIELTPHRARKIAAALLDWAESGFDVDDEKPGRPCGPTRVHVETVTPEQKTAARRLSEISEELYRQRNRLRNVRTEEARQAARADIDRLLEEREQLGGDRRRIKGLR